MKILVFVEKYMSPTLLFIYNEITELAKTNEVLLVTTEYTESAKSFPFGNIRIIPFKQNKFAAKLNWLLERSDIVLTRKNGTFSQQLKTIINSFKPDIIHGHFGYESLVLLENMKHAPCPVFVSFHGYDASEMLRLTCYVKKLNYHINRFAITPIYVSKYMYKDLEKAGIYLINAKLLYYGTDMDYFKPIQNPEPNNDAANKKIVFLQISSFKEKKGHIYTLKAFKVFLEQVENKNRYKLILAGGGPLLETVKNETKNLGLIDFVEFTGMITYKETKPLLQQADIFVHHSTTSSTGQKEGIPNALMEAMAMELPVISTFHAGIPELVEDGINGYLVQEKDIETYASRMKDIINWKRLPINRLKVEAFFSRTAHNTKLLEIYSGN